MTKCVSSATIKLQNGLHNLTGPKHTTDSFLIMTFVVQLYVGGKTFNEEVQATNPKDARETALARNPKAKVIGVNVKF
jgi:hypothetical protein